MINRIAEALRHPEELSPLYKLMVQYRIFKPDKRSIDELANSLSDLDFCYATLTKVSRSFAVVIQQLPEELRDPVCIFYLVLRALDSIEDDTSTDTECRIKLLEEFHGYLHVNGWKVKDVGDKEDYRLLLENFDKVIHRFKCLDKKYQDVITRICQQMGEGMVKYLDKEILDLDDYNQYCYYVAGLVGEGLTDLFVISGIQNESIKCSDQLSVSMGLFLQKTNIIRDYLEDLSDNRSFWPKEIWSKYGNTLDTFSQNISKQRIYCLNHLILDALQHVPDCLRYLKLLQNPKVFNFCAIPQLMAIATLAELYNNEDVFKMNVKIRRGLAAKLIFQGSDFQKIFGIYEDMCKTIFGKISLDDPNVSQLRAQLHDILNMRDSNHNTPVNLPNQLTVHSANDTDIYQEINN